MPKLVENKLSTSYIVGMLMLLMMSFTYAGGAIMMFLGWSNVELHLAIGCLCALLIMAYLSSWQQLVRSVCIVLMLTVISIFFAVTIYDWSCDGNTYHQNIINALAFSNWNPYKEIAGGPGLSLWSMHYAKAVEWLQACVVSVTDTLEAGKAINFIFSCLTGFILWDYITTRYSQLSTMHKVMMMSLVLLHPVTLCQILTYYIDFYGYYYVVLTIVFSLGIFSQRNLLTNYLGLTSVILLAAGTKFNMLFWEGCTIGVIILGMLIFHRQQPGRCQILCEIKRYASISFGMAVLSFFVFCYHPYMTNWIGFGNPFFPLMGHDSIDIMTPLLPEELVGHNRVYAFFRMIYAVRGMMYDSSIGGFGPMFSILFTGAIVWLVFEIKRNHGLTPLTYAAVVIILSCFVFEQTWWPRYITQLWLIVPIMYLSLVSYTGAISRWITIAISWIVGVNVAVCIFYSLVWSIKLTVYRRAIFQELAGSEVRLTSIEPQWTRQLNEREIQVEQLDSITPDYVYKSYIYVDSCYNDYFPLIEITDEQNDKIDSIYFNNPIISSWEKVKHGVRSRVQACKQ
jgi:hypothetical protein